MKKKFLFFLLSLCLILSINIDSVNILAYANPTYLGSYINSTHTLKNIECEDSELLFSTLHSVIEFGKTWKDIEDDEPDYGTTWYVLNKDNGLAVLLSPFIVTYKKYDDGDNVDWENSSLRKWLNGDFYDYVFDASDKAGIVTYEKTDDKVFILSKEEIDLYFPERKIVENKPFDEIDKYTFCPSPKVIASTSYIEELKSNNNYINEFSDIFSFWVRNDEHDKVLEVCNAKREFKEVSADQYCGVRPAICVRYDVNAGNPIEEATKKIPFFDTIKDKVVPPIFSDIFDSITGLYFGNRE